MKQKKLFISLIITVGLIALILTVQATLGSASSVYTPSQLVRDAGPVDQPRAIHRVRIAGRVSDDPISYIVEPSIELKFSVVDRENPAERLPVVYRNLKPDMFAAGRDVLIDGDFVEGVFEASSLLTQCPSKYEPPSPTEGGSAEYRG